MEVVRNRHSMSVSITESDTQEMGHQVKYTCSQRVAKVVRRKLPILSWLPQYKVRFILSDLLAGITVWLTAIPQSMADAGIAGMSPEYGLYSHALGPLIYVFLGTCRNIAIGPTAVISLLSYQTCGDDYPECTILLGFYSGVVELVFGLLNLGVLVSFISEPVTVGFTAGAAVTIASGQVKFLLGLGGKAKGSAFIQAWSHVIENIDTVRSGDTILGLLALMFLLIFRKLIALPPPRGLGNPQVWKTAFKFLSLIRNAVVMFVTVLIAYLWTDPPFVLTGYVREGFPPIEAPPFEFVDIAANSTEPMSAVESLKYVGTGTLTVAFVAILQNVAIAKAYSNGQTVDGTQEMVALGVVNCLGGFFSCIPTAASFTRSALNEASGVKSTLSGIFLGSFMILSIGVLTPSFEYVPKSALAAVIISAMIFLIEYETIWLIWKVSKIDFFCCVATFVCSLAVGMQYGIAIGAAINVVILLLKSLRPRATAQCLTDGSSRVKYLLVEPDIGLYFPGVDYTRDKVIKLAQRHPGYPVIVIQCDRWTHWDYTSANSMVSLAKSLAKGGKTLILYRLLPSWSRAFERLGSHDVPICCSTGSELCQIFSKLNAKEEQNNKEFNNNG